MQTSDIHASTRLFLGNTAHSVENKENTFTCKILRENSIRWIWYVDFTEFLRKIGVSKFFQFPHSVDSLFRWITFVTQKVTEKKLTLPKWKQVLKCWRFSTCQNFFWSFFFGKNYTASRTQILKYVYNFKRNFLKQFLMSR